MYRDIELLRQLLLAIEPYPYPNQHLIFRLDGYEDEVVTEHMRLLIEATFVEAANNPYSCFDEWDNVRLTWAGHEYLELIRHPQQWAKVKALLAEMPGQNMQLLQQKLVKQLLAE